MKTLDASLILSALMLVAVPAAATPQVASQASDSPASAATPTAPDAQVATEPTAAAELAVEAVPAPQAEVTPVTMRFGGRLQFDLSTFTDSTPYGGLLGEVDSGYEVRRARLFVDGALYDRIEYKLEVDFAGNEVTPKDTYVGVRGLPVTARVGIQKEPFSIEELTSARFITFMERSLVNAFAPSRQMGILVGDTIDNRTTWNAGIFRLADGFVAQPGDNYQFTARVTHAPIYSDDSRELLHLGVAYQHRSIEGSYRLSARPGDHTAPKLLSVAIPADSSDTLSFEISANVGSLGVQGEYVSASVDALDGGSPTLNGYYAQASYFLTGETRPYRGGRFDRVRPTSNFLEGDGSGAWEIGLRYARLDLTEATGSGLGELWNLTAGLNWYWNPNFRTMLNYEIAGLPALESDDTASIVHLRLSMDF